LNPGTGPQTKKLQGPPKSHSTVLSVASLAIPLTLAIWWGACWARCPSRRLVIGVNHCYCGE